MAEPKVFQYKHTASNLDITSATRATFNIPTGKCALAGTYLINSFSAGEVTVQYKVTVGGSVGSFEDATIAGATINTNGVVCTAKNRAIRKHLTWEFYKDLMPNNYTTVVIKLTWKDSDGTSNIEEITTSLDSRLNVINLKSMSFGADSTPTFEFAHPMPLKGIKAKPVLEYGVDKSFNSIDHTVTAFQYFNGTNYVSGNATTGETVATTAPLKMKITATSAISGTENYRIRLVPVSFT